jgi:hypothetical protein
MVEAFADLSTPLVADAWLRCGVPLRAAPPGIGPVVAGQRIAGRVLPVRHYGDTPELAAIGVPVFSYGSYPAGPGARGPAPLPLTATRETSRPADTE